ncbi:MAG: hypothetical protein J5I90_21835 [Caldilineales bacterium]|nr:hypothetical protein [Caldilineales bacterium]
MGNFGFGFVVGFVASILVLKLLDDDEDWVIEVPMEASPAFDLEKTSDLDQAQVQ